MVAVPPLGPACEDLFAETCFQVVDPRGKRWAGLQVAVVVMLMFRVMVRFRVRVG